MANAKAHLEKEKGNAAFKTGDFPAAIGHYTSAILADGNDYTFPLNRAAAYLKLGKNEDAGRDCSTVLKLNAYNAKALFRRAQARIGMGNLDDALSDLTQALKREPANESVKEEIKRVNNLLQTQKKKTSKLQSSAPSSTSIPKRRRVPIKIIDPPETNSAPTPSTSNPTRESRNEPHSQALGPSVDVPEKIQSTTDSLTPVSTRSLKPTHPPQVQTAIHVRPSGPGTTSTTAALPTPSETVSAPPVTKSEQPRSFKEVKQARDSGKPSRVGGGIFRASGENTMFPTRNGTGATDPRRSDSTITSQPISSEVVQEKGSGVQPLLPEKPPATLFDFSRAWDSAPSLAERWGLVLSIPSTDIPTLFKTSLEPKLLVDIISVFKEVLGGSRDDKATVSRYMDAFAKVQRIETVVLFLSRDEKEVVRGCWEALGLKKEDVTKIWRTVWM